MAVSVSTESLARHSAGRPWTVVGLWVLLLLVAGAVVASMLEDGLTTRFVFTNTPEAQRGLDLIEEMKGPSSTNEVVIVRSDSMTVDSPAFQAIVEGIFGDLQALGPDVIRQDTLISYYQTGAPFLVSEDGHTTMIPFTMAGDFDDASKNISRVVRVVDQNAGQSQFNVVITGQATVGLDFREVSDEDLQKGEAFGVPVALLILVLVFGAVVAALVPLVLAAVSIVVAMGVAALVGQAFQLSFFVTNMITMIGLAVGIDYSLFIVARYREERGRGLGKVEAIGRTGATATRTVFFSGMTVVLALAGMLIIPFNLFISLGLGAIFVVVAAVLASMTLLPAVLSLLGDKVDRLSIPWIGMAPIRFNEQRSGGFWDRLSRTVMRKPLVSLLLAGGVLALAAIPAFDLTTGFAGVSTMPDGIRSKEGFLTLDREFSAGQVTPAEIVIEGDIHSQPVQDAVERLTLALEQDAAFAQPHPLEEGRDGTLAILSVPVAGDSASQEAQDAVRRLRSNIVPMAFAGVPANVYVTGETAYNMDFFSQIRGIAPFVFAFVLSVSFVLLMMVFRSIVIPLKAIVLNLLSVGATYGILVLIFQKGVGNELLGFQQSDIVEAWIPLFLFSILFGLSMDYHVFLLSRIREHFDQTRDNTGSVAFGIRTTGRLITGAALIMVAVFWGFATGSIVGLQQVGFGLGIAILLDASIVRIILVPAGMRLLGRWNWYLPSVLHWLPDFRVEAHTTTPATSTEG
ncbi:MAG: MMPL family transporter [Chloroflexi bacterium]|nr:MMPL family transporter [Chloroflexota bacterium]